MPAERLSVTRRNVLALPAVAAAATVAGPLLVPGAAEAAGTAAAHHPHTPFTSRKLVDRDLARPVARAYTYLNTVQDAYFKGNEPRLLQSYNNESGLMTTAFVYDNALAIFAYLANPSRENVRRARLIGDAFLFIQNNDEKYTDGRVRQAYAAGPMQFYGGGAYFPGIKRDDGKAAFLWPFGFGGSATGDIAWTSLALAELYAQTRVKKYLDGAVALAEWIAERPSPYTFGGYHGGIQNDGETAQRWTSTEHNIDVYGLFTILAKLTHNRRWTHRADVARDFVHKMWDRQGRFFWTGTLGGLPGEDPNLINKGNIPEDVQTWAMLSLRERRYDSAADWVIDNLSNTDRPGPGSQIPAGVTVSGVTFSDQAKKLTGTVSGGDVPNNRNAVWLEGNAHLAAALLYRDNHGDTRLAKKLLHQAVVAQEKIGAGQTVGLTADPDHGKLSNPGEGGSFTGTVLPARSGIVATTSAFDTGFAFSYFQRQHVGATSWFLMAALGTNPYK
jgi:hypothetical protein